MKKTLLATVAVTALLIAQPSHAADLATRPILKAPPMAPVFSWTGCFVGGQLGWGWQRSHINQKASGSSIHVAGASNSIDSNGPVFGGQVGCNYQVGNSFVIGAQGTFLAADIDGIGQDSTNSVGGNQGTVSITSSSIFSATGRLGFTGLMPQTMFYVRGGAAWMRTQYDLTHANLNYSFSSNAPLFDVTHQGWTIGGGVEWMFLANWSAFLEYNYYRFDSISISASHLTFTDTFTSQPNVSTVTVGLNYHFGMH